MSGSDRSWAQEAPRDQGESAFTPILRRLLHRTTGVIAVCFVDGEGECVDYASSLSPFEIKVTGAQLLVTMEETAARLRTISAGEAWWVHVQGSERELACRRVSEDYLLVVVTKPRAMTRRLMGGIEQTVAELRREAEIDAPRWETVADSVRVEVRRAVGWPYAPAAYVDEQGQRVVIDDVLGRWTEGTGRRSKVAFRVRTEGGEELTLVHHRAADRWERQPER